MPIQKVAVLPKFLFVLRIFGSSFLPFKSLCVILMNFVYGNQEKESILSVEQFRAETESIQALLPGSSNKLLKHFRELQEVGLHNNTPTGCLLLTERKACRKCLKKLTLDPKLHTITVYDAVLGCFLGSRAIKYCRQCKIYEHYGFWTENGGKRHYDENALENEYLLSTEDTAFGINVLKEFTSFLVVGAIPFSTFAQCFNKRFDLKERSKDMQEATGSVAKRQKKDVTHLWKERCGMDRRRLEDGFILYSVLRIRIMHSIEVTHFPYDRNELLEMVTEDYHKAFVKKWGDHVCCKKGCQNVIVLDGNMKNCRQICSCKNVTELKFDSLAGGISVGCLNTPSKGSRLCSVHTDTACKFRDDEKENAEKGKNEDDVIALKILNEKETRNDKFFEILWSDARKSWVKESNMPETVGNMKSVSITEFGQRRRELRSSVGVEEQEGTVFVSSGFGVETVDDNEVLHDGIKESLKCQTEKGKQKCKNRKSAGIIVFEKPCGVVMDIREIFGSESKSQVYGHLHQLLSKSNMEDVDVICYDDACHLKKFAQNPKRRGESKTSEKLATMEIVCDRFHFKNHVGKWCKEHCNPYKCEKLEEVNTEVCEQLFSWLSKFGPISRHMNRYRFVFLMLYVLDDHNLDIINK